MKLTQVVREELVWCCQLRRDFFVEIEKDLNPTDEKIDNEFYRRFQGLVIGTNLIENTGKRSCLLCLQFRHSALDYYDQRIRERKHGKS